MTNKNKYIGIFSLLGVALLGYVYYRGTKKTTIARVPLDSGGGVSQSFLESLSARIYESDKGLNVPFFNEHDEEAYQLALELSNADLTRLYNVFNSKYQNELNETLTTFVSAQYASDASTYGTYKKVLLGRLSSNNLT
jgi:hypothetical protein